MNSEKLLIERIKKSKNEQDFSALINLYEEQVLNFLKNKTFSSGLDHKDIFNKALLKTWNNIENFQEKSSFKTWFFKINKNILFDEYKKRKKINNMEREINPEVDYESDPVVDFQAPSSILMNEELKNELLAKIAEVKNALGQKHLQIFELVFEQEKSYKEVSEILNCSLGTVMSRVFYTRKKMQEFLNKHQFLLDKTSALI